MEMKDKSFIRFLKDKHPIFHVPYWVLFILVPIAIMPPLLEGDIIGFSIKTPIVIFGCWFLYSQWKKGQTKSE